MTKETKSRARIDRAFEKRLTYAKGFLRGRKYYVALRALEFARPYHSHRRRDGSAEFLHQIRMMLYHMSIIDTLVFPEEVLATDVLHDLCEDYDVDIGLIRLNFGDRIADAVWHMTKEYRGVKKSIEQYMAELGQDVVASIVKGADRLHNFETMRGAFTPEGRARYVEEGEQHILPMLKAATRNFPEQAAAFHNIRHFLRNQIELLRQMADV